jgi:protein phosphatase
MGPIYRIIQTIRLFFSGLLRPFSSIGFFIRSAQANNPLVLLRRAFQGIGRQISAILRWPKLNLPLPKGMKVSVEDWREDFRRADEVKKRVKAPQRAQFSQIHLVNQTTGERTVLHIGTLVGRGATDTTLNGVHVQFMQSEAGAKAPITAKRLDSGPLTIDGIPLKGSGGISNGSLLGINGADFACELFAWDVTPVVTRVNASWATSVGNVRERNEDAIGIYQHPRAYLFAVADGVGSGEASDEVSALAVRYLLAAFHRNVRYQMNWSEVLQKAFENINAEVRQFARRSAFPVGTTLTAVIIQDYTAYVAHVGDSRLYHGHEHFAQQVTIDHVRQMPVIQDTRRANEADVPPPNRDVLIKAIGKSDTIQPDIFTIRLQPGDKLLLCTDGIPKEVSLDEINDILYGSHPREVAGRLTALANERGGTDNATAVALDVMVEPYIEDIWKAQPDKRVFVGYNPSWKLRMGKPQQPDTRTPADTRAGCLLVAVVLVVAALLFAGRARAAEPIFDADKGLKPLVSTQEPDTFMTPIPVAGQGLREGG